MKQVTVTNTTIINSIKTSKIYEVTVKNINSIKKECKDKLEQELVLNNNVVSVILRTNKDIKYKQELGVIVNNTFVPDKLIFFVNR